MAKNINFKQKQSLYKHYSTDSFTTIVIIAMQK